jgi:hypothetical protein
MVVSVTAAYAATVSVAPDRMAVVNGQRTFVVGLYEYLKDDAVLKQAADAGFNLMNCSGKTEELDRLQRAGIFGWVNVGMSIDLGADAATRAGQLDALVKGPGAHDALMVWEVPDEALWNCFYGAVQWREAESAQLRGLIDAVADPAQKQAFSDELALSQKLRGAGEYAQSEALADALWKKLGKESPNPGYGVANAQERADKLCAGMCEGYAKLRALDPKHPVWMNHAPRNQIAQLAEFAHAADAVGCDIYPVPIGPRSGHSDLMDKTVSSVGAYTDRMQASAPGKPVWMVLQSFGWADIRPDLSEADKKELRRPTLEETRFMACDAIVHGARGVLYWGTVAVPKDAPFWTDLLTVVSELKKLQPMLAAPDVATALPVELEPAAGSVDRGVRVLGKQTEKGIGLIVANECPDPLTCTIRGLGAMDGKTYVDLFEGVRATVRDGGLRLTIRPQRALALQAE